MRTRHLVAVGLLCLALLPAGCARGGSGSAAASGGSGSPLPSSAPDPSVSIGSPAPPSGSPTPPDPGVSMVLTGQVEPGVEPRCLILHDGGKTYQLIGGDPAVVKAGARVRVTGHFAAGVMGYCMQGEPFQVTGAQAL